MIERALMQAMGTGRLAHGLLFCGPPGSGREKTARGVAAGLLCERKELPFGCNECRACRRAVSGNHPDVHILMSDADAVRRGIAQPEGKKKPSELILVDAVRELAVRLRMAPFEGGARVCIVVDAHKMNDNAQNALLKTLEEPGANTFLILIVPHERTVLPTIASRCLRLRFPPAPAAELAPNATADALLHAILRGNAAERMDAAEAAGKERADVDAALAALEQRLVREIRGEGDWRRLAAVLEAVGEAREAIGQNASIQLCLEQLLLTKAPPVPAAPVAATR